VILSTVGTGNRSIRQVGATQARNLRQKGPTALVAAPSTRHNGTMISSHDDAPQGEVAGIAGSPEEGELVEISEEDCYALLGSQDLGRLAVVRDGQPEIFPVNYGLDGRTVVIRTQPGVKLSYAALARVAFEVEEIDPKRREGWVVVVKGEGEDITDAIDPWSEHARAHAVRPWVSGAHEGHIAIARPVVSGRRLRGRPLPSAQ